MFETFEHTADIGVRGFGKNFGEAFCEAAKAAFSVMVDLKKVKAKRKFSVKISAGNLGRLFVDWLNQLIFLSETKNVFFSKFSAKVTEPFSDAKAAGKSGHLVEHSSTRPRKTAVLQGKGPKQKGVWKLQGFAWGEKIDAEKHQPKSHVKAATLSQLEVGKKGKRFFAQCVVDI